MDVHELYRSAERLLAARDAQAAVPLLEQAARELPGERSVQRLLALAHYGAGAFDAAETVLREVVAADPLDADALSLLGQVLERTGRAAEAQQHLALAGRLDPAYAVRCDVWGRRA